MTSSQKKSKFTANKEIVERVLTLHAVSNPKLTGTSLLFKSPSIVFGHPITRVFIFLPLKDKHKRKNPLMISIIKTKNTFYSYTLESEPIRDRENAKKSSDNVYKCIA